MEQKQILEIIADLTLLVGGLNQTQSQLAAFYGAQVGLTDATYESLKILVEHGKERDARVTAIAAKLEEYVK